MRHLTAVLLFALLAFTFTSASDQRLVNTVASRTTEFRIVMSDKTPLDFACVRSTLPEAVNTPNPAIGQGGKAVLDFLVDTDGKVVTVILLESAGTESTAALRTLRSWKFRPATCNGIPVTVEGHVTFQQ